MALSDTAIRKMKPRKKVYRRSDGNNLFIEVRPNGSKLWRMAYRFNGKQKLMAFGRYPEVTLSRARQKGFKARTLLEDGFDPRALQAAEKAEALAASEHTFAKIGRELIEKLRKEGKADSTLSKKQWLIDMASVDFGNLPIRDLSPAVVLQTLRKVEAKGHHETANRLRTTIGQVCRYAVATTRSNDDPTYALRGALVAPKVTHVPAITDKEGFEELARDVWRYRGATSTQTALKLCLLMYPRPGELRAARWNEFDLEQQTWTIPAEREKNRREHVKPISDAALRLLLEQRDCYRFGDLVFPGGADPRKPLSENAVNDALKRLGYKGRHTSHGFRATASSLLNESGLWDPDAIEAELGHLGPNQVRRAYHRSTYWDERVRMAEWWASKVTDALRS